MFFLWSSLGEIDNSLLSKKSYFKKGATLFCTAAEKFCSHNFQEIAEAPLAKYLLTVLFNPKCIEGKLSIIMQNWSRKIMIAIQLLQLSFSQPYPISPFLTAWKPSPDPHKQQKSWLQITRVSQSASFSPENRKHKHPDQRYFIWAEKP